MWLIFKAKSHFEVENGNISFSKYHNKHLKFKISLLLICFSRKNDRLR